VKKISNLSLNGIVVHHSVTYVLELALAAW